MLPEARNTAQGECAVAGAFHSVRSRGVGSCQRTRPGHQAARPSEERGSTGSATESAVLRRADVLNARPSSRAENRKSLSASAVSRGVHGEEPKSIAAAGERFSPGAHHPGVSSARSAESVGRGGGRAGCGGRGDRWTPVSLWASGLAWGAGESVGLDVAVVAGTVARGERRRVGHALTANGLEPDRSRGVDVRQARRGAEGSACSGVDGRGGATRRR